MNTNEKEFEEFLARLNPKTAQSFRRASEIHDEVLLTPSLGVNMAIDGIGYGRFTTLYGNKGSGKTMFALECCGKAQKEGKIVAWVDVEKNFNPTWARQLGVNPDLVANSRNIMSIADMADEVRDLIVKGADVVVVDSISQLMPQSFFEDTKEKKGGGELKGLADTGQIGTFSKNLGQAINIINGVNEKTAVIFISQVRNKIGSYGASISMMGGLALEHASSTILKFWRTPSDLVFKEVHVGDGLLLKRPVGAKVTWTAEKHRGAGMGMSNEYDLYFKGDNVGVDLASEVVAYGTEFGVLTKSGNWLEFEGVKLNGKATFIDYLHEHDDILEKVYGEILAKSV